MKACGGLLLVTVPFSIKNFYACTQNLQLVIHGRRLDCFPPALHFIPFRQSTSRNEQHDGPPRRGTFFLRPLPSFQALSPRLKLSKHRNKSSKGSMATASSVTMNTTSLNSGPKRSRYLRSTRSADDDCALLVHVKVTAPSYLLSSTLCQSVELDSTISTSIISP
ncbi:hypothetical protein LMH87_009423 [Akanthomyces muscarius]|uniref:Uncharacterized protein n=1 Tax=Akanthomyces muscarius TaxID=2231603 RepID=A0A9W8ULV7_AKAMU|nr:hypothetical protein LMH87_009423 [Akanthomyces muscarius]KAJ4152905.1 hypothetical protein LMH87_009423 [Akanthomyces muscarius]